MIVTNILNNNALDRWFLMDLLSCGMMDPYPHDPEKQLISSRIEQQFRDSYHQAASEAAALAVNPDDPYGDISSRLGLRKAEQQRNLIRCSLNNKKLRRLELDAYYRDRRAPLEYYHSNVKRAIQRAVRLAYWRGRVHALSSIEQAYFDTDLPEDSPYIHWAYFHKKLIKPWAVQVQAWATSPLEPKEGYPYRCPPDLFSIAYRLANNRH